MLRRANAWRRVRIPVNHGFVGLTSEGLVATAYGVFLLKADSVQLLRGIDIDHVALITKTFSRFLTAALNIVK